MQIEQLKTIIEAALLASSQPLNVQHLGELFEAADGVNHELIARALESLASDCAGRGIELHEVASGFRYQVNQAVHPWIARMWTEKPSRYSRALLETLALIAYRQPITRPEIEQIRGVVVSTNIIKTMEEREWIRVVGYRDMPGKPALFGTTRAFLDYFNLKSLDQLPPLSDIRDMEDPQLRFDQTPLPARIVRELSIDPDGDLDGELDGQGNIPADDAMPDESHQSPERAPDNPAAPAVPPDESEPNPNATADEAAIPADVESDAAQQDTQEYRA